MSSIRKISFSLVAVLSSLATNKILADEPNESFPFATIVPPGITTVSDTLTAGYKYAPDTYLGTLNMFGSIQYENDDDSIYGDGYASGLSGVPINPGGTIDFWVTGYGDPGFTGNHAEYGEYGIVIGIYDFYGDFVTNYYEYATMEPGLVNEFSIAGDESWINGTYDINIDNLWGEPEGGDVDFYTFTGLTAGQNFIVDVGQLEPDGFDSMLGWYDSDGLLIDFNDDGPSGVLSQLQGTVPENGELTFAVTAWPDYDFLGHHDFDAEYSLDLSFFGVAVDGDYDNDNDVDGRDFLIWQRGDSPNGLIEVDLVAWQENYDGVIEVLNAVPEPGSFSLLAIAVISIAAARRRQL